MASLELLSVSKNTVETMKIEPIQSIIPKDVFNHNTEKIAADNGSTQANKLASVGPIVLTPSR